ncbi:MAG: CRISPR-associated endonuclease Cas2 [Fimbriimonadaceae bacterium]|nr:CRISPR-associated endonuclease Cas2 [Fimbriimonadaceae bacterium]
MDDTRQYRTGANKTFFVFAYDIPDDRRRTKVANVLEGYGTRVNDSVFECVLDPRRYRALRARLQRHLVPSDDALRIYPLCDACVRRVETVGGLPVTVLPDLLIL